MKAREQIHGGYENVYGTDMTRAQIEAGKTMPPLFTGKWHGVHYVRGVRYDGPTNTYPGKLPAAHFVKGTRKVFATTRAS